MTTPARPRGPGQPNIIELDAIDDNECEWDQHTPATSTAGLAALVRQTAPPPPDADQTRSLRPPKQVRRPPPNPPPAAHTPSVPGLAALPEPDPSPLPVAPARRATSEAAANFEEAVTVPMNARQTAVLLPLQAPGSSPLVGPSRPPAPAPPSARLPAATSALPRVPDHTPAARLDVHAPDEPADRAAAASLTPRYGSLRVLAVIGGASTALLIAVAIVLVQRPSSPPRVASSTPEPGPARRPPLPPPHPRAAPVRDPGLVEASPTTMPGPNVIVPALRALATVTRAPAPRVEPSDRGEQPAERRPKPPRPMPALHGTRTASVPPVPTLAEMNADDEPAIAQARAAYAAGNQLLFDGDFPGAIASYRRSLDYAPSYAAGHRGLGLAYMQQGEDDDAIKAFRAYLGLAPRAKDVAMIKQRITALAASHR